MSAIYMRRSPTADAPTAGGWTLIDQTDALVDDAEITKATSELKQEIGLPDSMDSEERGEIVEADAVINRGAALARDPRVQRSVLESLVAAQPVAAAPAFPDEAARLRREVEELKRELGRVLQERTNTPDPEPSLGVASLLITRCLERRRERGDERDRRCPSLQACLAVPGAVVHCLAPGPGGRLVDCLATEPPTMVRDVRA